MAFVLLHRINIEKNEARFYLVMTGPTLFHPLAVTRYWGRINGAQRGMVTPCESPEEAEEVAARLIAKKLKRGYVEVKIEMSKKETRDNG